jgi:signal peptide peptidase SppA
MKIIRPKNENSISAETKEIIQSRPQSKIDQILSILPFNIRGSKPVIAVLRLDGAIGKVSSYKTGLTLHSLNKLIESIFKIDRLEALFLSINSPGGSPAQSELIASRIITLASSAEIPVYSFVEEVAASGGYWLACAGNKIFATKSSIIGSIGVIYSSFGFNEVIKKMGIERRIYTQGNNKSVLDPFSPTKPADVTLVKNLGKNIHGHFIDYVKTRRAGRLTQSDEILFNGEFWTGQTALDYGLIDGIDDMYSYIGKHWGEDIKIEYIENKQSWLRKKLGMSTSSEDIAYEISDGFVSAIEDRLTHSGFKIK